MKNTKNCFLIGEDHLLIQCGDALIAENYSIAGIYSPLTESKTWALQNKIPYFSTYAECKAILLKNNFDYLFSIVNSKIIPNGILKNIKQFAINYHDAPLPLYGGANATGFALLNREKQHGVTWHIINELIDGGDILKQVFFEIEKEDTTFSLNIKCYQHGLLLFKELIKELSANTQKRIIQNLSNRTYHRREDRPKNNGWINWETSAETIELALRAYTVGNYQNKFSVLKFKIDNDAYIVLNLKITSNTSATVPGTISNILPNGLQISTKTNDILLLSIATIDGQSIKTSTIHKKHNLKVGSYLFSPSVQTGELFKIVSEKIAINEYFWVKTYQNFQPAEFPLFNYANQTFLNNELKIISKVPITKKLLMNIDAIKPVFDNNTDFFITIWFIYLYKLGNQHNNGILLKEYVSTDNNCFNEFISRDIPLNVNFNDDMTFEDAYLMVKNVKINATKKNGYLRDIFSRYPEIDRSKLLSPITIIIGDDEPTEHLKSLIFQISLSNKKLVWHIDSANLDKEPYIGSIMKNIANHYSTLMKSIFLDKKIMIKNMQLLSPKELNKIQYEWNNTKKEYPKTQYIHHIIEDITQKNPQKDAINYNGQILSYLNLDKKSNQLANYIVNQFPAKKQYILVYMDRCIELIISILGIFKSGCTYIPIAITTPLKNIELILNDSQSRLIITKDVFKKNLQFISSEIQILAYENISPLIKKCSDMNPNVPLLPDSLAYVIYTSGTTGIPKGVMIKHHSLVNLITDTILKTNINSRSRLLQFASISFDASVWEILTTLAAGAILCIPDQEQLLAGALLKKAIEQYKITFIILPPSILQTVSQYSFSSLKTVVTGGEYCSKELANHWTKKVKLINAYGPTEATVCVTMAKIKPNIKINPSIGKAIANTRLYILDKNLAFLPIGAIGELYIGGDSLSVGYLNKNQLTKSFFIKNPHSIDKKDVLYKTRDLVRWLPNGEIDYIGRADNQIKIRGFRVELEAIETQILHYPHITECAVLTHENETLGKHLIAYIACKKSTLELKKLREYLSQVLPDYMIPSFFVKLEHLPITTNGKIDRTKLSSFENHERINLHEYEAPHTLLEKRLTVIWSELLNISSIGVNDNFFSLGGHSLLVTNLSMYLFDEFDYTLALQHFFKSPTISNLAQLIENKNQLNSLIELHDCVTKDKELPNEIKPLSQSNIETNAILLTGATGFLGTHLLSDLYKNTSSQIYCIVRTKNVAQGLNKIKNELNKYQLSIQKFDRITVICGNLAKPKLGLTDKDFDYLTNKIDLIYHNGAYVHHLYDYEILRESNVLSTIELLKLCTLKKNKSLHYVSTLSAITDHHNKSNITLENFVDFSLKIPTTMSGYNQTKLVSEYLLSQARARNIEINIYRPGWIMGQHDTGIMTVENNHLLLLLKGCTQIGFAPDWDIILNIMPVDFISKFIVQVSLEKKLINKVYNLHNNSLQIKWSDMIDFLNIKGFSLKIIPAREWHKKIEKVNSHNALYNLLSLYRDENALEHQMRSIYSKISNNNTKHAMEYLHINQNISKNELLETYINFLEMQNFLNK
ncbi:MAG: hypothetical protein CK424_06770 [Legionella sp.]|nr:MAG: hypothetical protein CK424_06770 [Legionella sp.]